MAVNYSLNTDTEIFQYAIRITQIECKHHEGKGTKLICFRIFCMPDKEKVFVIFTHFSLTLSNWQNNTQLVPSNDQNTKQDKHIACVWWEQNMRNLKSLFSVQWESLPFLCVGFHLDPISLAQSTQRGCWKLVTTSHRFTGGSSCSWKYLTWANDEAASITHRQDVANARSPVSLETMRA